MRKTPTPKKSPPFISTWTVLALLAVWLLSSCATPPQPLPSEPVRSVQLPPLPTFARQPATPSVCWPTCLDALTTERKNWLTWLNNGALPAELVNGSTTKHEKN